MLLTMTSPIIDFDENEFINYVIDRYLNDGATDDIFDECFKSRFPTNEISENIRLKYYPGENYDSMSLYSILYNKVDDEFYDVEDSNADTEEFDSDEERLIYDDYDDY
jgi:hypothetical protein